MFADPFFSSDIGWNPRDTVRSLMSEVLTDFNQPIGGFNRGGLINQVQQPLLTGNISRSNFLVLDSWDSDNEFFVECEVPGVPKDKISVNIEQNMLTIKACKERIKEIDSNWIPYRRERMYGTDQRVLRLPVGVDVDKAQVNYHDGVLCICFPKTTKGAGMKKLQITG